MNNVNNDEISIRLDEIFEVIRYNIKIILTVVVISVLIGLGIILISKPVYKSTAKILVERIPVVLGREQVTVIFPDDREISSFISLINSYEVIKITLEKLYPEEKVSYDKIESFSKQLKVRRVDGNYLWNIEFLGSTSPENSVKKLKILLESYFEYIGIISKKSPSHLHPQEIDSLKQKLDSLEKKIKDFQTKHKIVDYGKQKEELALRIEQISGLIDIRVIEQPYANTKPIAPRKRVILIVSLMLGILSSLVIIVLKISFLKPYLNIDQIKQELDIPILGKFPEIKGINKVNKITQLVFSNGKDIKVLKEYLENNLTNLLVAYNFKFPLTFGITSAMPGEGKSVISALLSCGFAMKDKKILLIDFDIYKKRITELFDLEKGVEEEFTIARSKDLKNLHILYIPSKINREKDDREEILNKYIQFVKEKIDLYKNQYDVIILDTFPAIITNKIFMFKELNFDIIFLINLFETPSEILKECIERTKKVGFNVKGIFVNKTRNLREQYSYYSYYKYYSHYYKSS